MCVCMYELCVLVRLACGGAAAGRSSVLWVRQGGGALWVAHDMHTLTGRLVTGGGSVLGSF